MTDKPNYRITIRPQYNYSLWRPITQWGIDFWSDDCFMDAGKTPNLCDCIGILGHHPDSSKHPSKLKKV